MRHLQSFGRDGGHTTQVCLIALVLQNCFLAKLNSVLFFKLLDQGLQELLLSPHLYNLGLDLERDPLLHALLMHLVAADLGKQLHVPQRPEKETALVKVLTKFFAAFLLLDLLSVLFPGAEQFLGFVGVAPLVDPRHDDSFVAVTLR